MSYLASLHLADLDTWVRHCVDGRSMRAVSRELGCEPSTVMRRVRRFEDRLECPQWAHMAEVLARKRTGPVELHVALEFFGTDATTLAGFYTERRVELLRPGAEVCVLADSPTAILAPSKRKRAFPVSLVSGGLLMHWLEFSRRVSSQISTFKATPHFQNDFPREARALQTSASSRRLEHDPV